VLSISAYVFNSVDTFALAQNEQNYFSVCGHPSYTITGTTSSDNAIITDEAFAKANPTTWEGIYPICV
jgi:hypothetical protein